MHTYHTNQSPELIRVAYVHEEKCERVGGWIDHNKNDETKQKEVEISRMSYHG